MADTDVVGMAAITTNDMGEAGVQVPAILYA
jgi:hypothetical protein